MAEKETSIEVERESQWLLICFVLTVAGRVTSKSSTNRTPLSCGEDNAPVMPPLNVAPPFSTTGQRAGPRTASIKGSQSTRLEVVMERRTADVEDSVPDARM